MQSQGAATTASQPPRPYGPWMRSWSKDSTTWCSSGPCIACLCSEAFWILHINIFHSSIEHSTHYISFHSTCSWFHWFFCHLLARHLFEQLHQRTYMGSSEEKVLRWRYRCPHRPIYQWCSMTLWSTLFFKSYQLNVVNVCHYDPILSARCCDFCPRDLKLPTKLVEVTRHRSKSKPIIDLSTPLASPLRNPTNHGSS